MVYVDFFVLPILLLKFKCYLAWIDNLGMIFLTSITHVVVVSVRKLPFSLGA